jgi:hypothetical protein
MTADRRPSLPGRTPDDTSLPGPELASAGPATQLRCYARIHLHAAKWGVLSAAAFDEQQGNVVVELPSDMALQLRPQRLQPGFQVGAD